MTTSPLQTAKNGQETDQATARNWSTSHLQSSRNQSNFQSQSNSVNSSRNRSKPVKRAHFLHAPTLYLGNQLTQTQGFKTNKITVYTSKPAKSGLAKAGNAKRLQLPKWGPALSQKLPSTPNTCAFSVSRLEQTSHGFLTCPKKVGEGARLELLMKKQNGEKELAPKEDKAKCKYRTLALHIECT